MKNVVFFSDLSCLPGLHVTLLTVLQRLSRPRDVRITVFADHIPEREKRRLRETWALAKSEAELVIRDFVPQAVGDLTSLHGNYTAYGRLFLSSLLPDADQCLYLDCDLIVHMAVDEIFASFDGKHTLLVNGNGDREFALDRELFIKSGIGLSAPCFNSGVMGIDLALWRARGRDAQIVAAAERYHDLLIAQDQSLLNLVFHDDFFAMGSKINHALNPQDSGVIAEGVINHLVGSPKPWDLFGSILSNYHGVWLEHYRATAIGAVPMIRYISLVRSVRIAPSLIRSLQRKLLKFVRKLPSRGSASL